jgi:hypothetical protein
MAIAYLGGRWIDGAKMRLHDGDTPRHHCLLLLPLAIFKYTDFVYRDVFGPFFGIRDGLLNVALPLGISFISFTLVAYLVDIYREAFSSKHRPATVLAHVLYFPHLIAGPILRPNELIPQLEQPRAPTLRGSTAALAIFTLGLVKKLVFADQLAPVVTATYAQDVTTSALAATLAIIGFAVQVYCDFSGYTDMAIGLAAMLGTRLPINFSRPRRPDQHFWQRWHMTLTLPGDYVYLPLSMKLARTPCAAARQWLMFLLAVVIPEHAFLVSGIWHGPAELYRVRYLYRPAMTVEFAKVGRRCRSCPARWHGAYHAGLPDQPLFLPPAPDKAAMMVASAAVAGAASGRSSPKTSSHFLDRRFAALHRLDDHRLVRHARAGRSRVGLGRHAVWWTLPSVSYGNRALSISISEWHPRGRSDRWCRHRTLALRKVGMRDTARHSFRPMKTK